MQQAHDTKHYLRKKNLLQNDKLVPNLAVKDEVDKLYYTA